VWREEDSIQLLDLAWIDITMVGHAFNSFFFLAFF
jgi:hypothetical protein